MKRKFLLPILSICMVVALVSVGFAAWLITGNDTTSANGQFVTAPAVNTYFTVMVTPATGSKIEFGKSNNTPTTNNSPWFDFKTESNEPSQESLSAEFTIVIAPDIGFKYTNEGTVYNESGFESVSSLFDTASVSKLTLTLSEVERTVQGSNGEEQKVKNTFDTAKTAGYVAYPSFNINSNSSAVSSVSGSTLASGMTIDLVADNFTVQTSGDNAGKATATVKITFAWGTTFNKQNPYTYYNNTYTDAKTAGDSVRKAATDALNALHGLNGVQYKIMPAVVLTTSGN